MKNKLFYDLHIHSCLSPCGDDEMTPNNIAGMASLKGLNILALTDHNSTMNCPEFFEACKNFGIIPIAGVEITTIEEIHVLVYFESLTDAMEFEKFLSTKRNFFENDPQVFGNQFVIRNDEVVEEEHTLLINSVNISVDEIFSIAEKYSGVAVPAHIDKNSNSIISVLGTVPQSEFTAFEFSDLNNSNIISKQIENVRDRLYLSNSDAHYLWDINEKNNFFLIDSNKLDVKEVTSAVFSLLRGIS